MLISEYLDIFIGHCKLKGLSKKTIDNYDRNVKKFIDYIGNIQIKELNYSLINNYISFLFDKVKENYFIEFDTKLSKSSIGTYLRDIKVFISYLEDEEFVNGITKKIKIPKQAKKLVQIYSDDEIKDFFKTIGSHTWLQYRNRAILALFLDSGLRLNEVIRLDLPDINFRDNYIRVFGKGEKERLVPIGYYTKKYLMKYINLRPLPNKDCNILFINQYLDRITQDSIKMIFYRINKKLDTNLSPHKLRHNFATNYCINSYQQYGNVDLFKLMTILGHSDTNTTRRYLHLANQIIISKSNISNIDSFMKK